MEFRILGRLEALDGGADVAPRRAQPRALLAMLLLHPNELISTDRLVEALWGDTPPATADKALQGHVSVLRKALGFDRLITERGGYRLKVEPGCTEKPCRAGQRRNRDSRRAARSDSSRTNSELCCSAFICDLLRLKHRAPGACAARKESRSRQSLTRACDGRQPSRDERCSNPAVLGGPREDVGREGRDRGAVHARCPECRTG